MQAHTVLGQEDIFKSHFVLVNRTINGLRQYHLILIMNYIYPDL